ncbi:Uncharacterized protein SCF082_LOCUS34065 [Durusdinium trenchii]|uniref:Uncharacterized protein n=1 Tax=Durusdinium trenchii TaxID=1381693 RepID=A0ABP0NXQ2_9DINO
MGHLRVLLFVLAPAILAAAKVWTFGDQSLHGIRLRDLGKEGLQAKEMALKEEIGRLEVNLDKSRKENAASIKKLKMQLNKTAQQFPDPPPLQSKDEEKLKKQIGMTEARLAEAYQQILAHSDVAQQARNELEFMASQAATCCEGTEKAKETKVSLLETRGHPRHLSEEEIAAMVNDLTGLTSDAVHQVNAAPEGIGVREEDAALVIEGLVRKVEELERRRAELQGQQQGDAERFEKVKAALLEKIETSSQKLQTAKIQAARDKEASQERQRTLAQQQTYASNLLTQQEAKLKLLKNHIEDYAARIKELFSLMKKCKCLAEGDSVWIPPSEVSTTTTTATSTTTTTSTSTPVSQVGLVRERKVKEVLANRSVELPEAEAGVTVYNSWDVDMEREKMKDANIKIYQALASDLTVQRGCNFTALLNRPAKARQIWCHPGPFWGIAQETSSDLIGQGMVHDMIVLPPSGSGEKEFMLLRFEIPSAGEYTLDLFGTQGIEGACANAFLFINGEERIASKHDADCLLPTTTNGRNIVHNLGQLAAGDLLYFAVAPGNDVAKDGVKVRFRITGAKQVRAVTSTTSMVATAF